MRLGAMALLAVAGVLAGGLPAGAHGDARVAAEEVLLAPGESALFPGELHYHRVVGRVQAGGPVLVRLVEVDSGEVVFLAGPDEMLRLNRLVACCDAVWTPHRLEVANPGTTPLRARVDVSLVHDDLAVMAHQAEAGVAESVAVMGLVWGVVVWRILRRPRRASFWRPVSWVVAVAGGVLTLGVLGAVRYGVGGPPALVAVLADLPVIPHNPLVSRASLLVGVAMVAWAVAAARWARARGTAPLAGWRALGVVQIGAVVVTVLLMKGAYGPSPIPPALGAVAALPLVAVLAAPAQLTQVSEGAKVVPGEEQI